MPTFRKTTTINGHRVTLYSYDGVTWASDRMELQLYSNRQHAERAKVATNFAAIVSHDEELRQREDAKPRRRVKRLYSSNHRKLSTVKAWGSNGRSNKQAITMAQRQEIV